MQTRKTVGDMVCIFSTKSTVTAKPILSVIKGWSMLPSPLGLTLTPQDNQVPNITMSYPDSPRWPGPYRRCVSPWLPKLIRSLSPLSHSDSPDDQILIAAVSLPDSPCSSFSYSEATRSSFCLPNSRVMNQEGNLFFQVAGTRLNQSTKLKG